MSDMSAPSIPNLLGLRGSRGGRGLRGRSRGRGGPHSSTAASTHDSIIQGTDTDAAMSRISAVDLDYLKDPYAHAFVVARMAGATLRRLPIINRGTYTRTTALDMLIDSFLSATAGKQRQIISLGAGTDTRVFRLFPKGGHGKLIYHEVDFPAITDKKFDIVKSSAVLRMVIRTPERTDQAPHTWCDQGLPDANQYWCHGVDLRDLSGPDVAQFQGLQTDIPTLLVSECCLCYLEVTEASSVIKYFTDQIPSLALILYEPIHPEDSFGRQMVSNLAARHIRMPTLKEYTDTTAQMARLRDAGFESACSLTIERIWEHWIPLDEKERVDSLEGLDEVEEWNLLAGHYAISWGWRGIDLEPWRINSP
ncbi:leucine carboxyl methyltransferase [Nemania sp. FL0916]|nr:leucine carboxyl methyltransferase [Nemania sp. FL0916]